MSVSEILNLMANLSIGLDKPTDDDTIIFLKYLNLAYSEILRKTSLTNPKFPAVREVLAVTDGLASAFSEEPFRILNVWEATKNYPLKGTNITKIMETDPNISFKGLPSQWYYFNNQLSIYPIFTGDVGVLYVIQPPLLTLNTLSSSILIPSLYLPILADGGCYYLFQNEASFKNTLKMEMASTRWEDGKRDLANHQRLMGAQTYYSTYSKV